MKVSLSIDLDFWCQSNRINFIPDRHYDKLDLNGSWNDVLNWADDLHHYRTVFRALPNIHQKNSMRHLLGRVCCLPRNVAVHVVEHHDEVLPYVQSTPCDMLINIDAHDDIVGTMDTPKLGPGSWVDFVEWRKEATYKWIYASRSVQDYSLCGPPALWKEPSRYTDWKKIQRSNDRYVIPWENVSLVTIAASPDYTLPNFGLFALKRLGNRDGIQIDEAVQELAKKWVVSSALFSTFKDL